MGGEGALWSHTADSVQYEKVGRMRRNALTAGGRETIDTEN